MAVQITTPTPLMPKGSVDFATALFDAADGPGGTPPVDGRLHAGLFRQYMQTASHVAAGYVTATAAGAADGIDVNCGFAPKAVLLFNETQVEAILKLPGMAGLFAAKLTGVPTFTFANTLLKFGNGAGDNENYFHYDAAEITAADVIRYLAIG